MYLKTIFHTLPDGTKAKFTIRDRIINDERYYYANVINIEIDEYKNLSDIQKETFYGMEITDGNQNSINYKNPERLINDILTKYGESYLKTEI
jgi:hypothetical protein